MNLEALARTAPGDVQDFELRSGRASFVWRHENMDGSVIEFALVVWRGLDGRLVVMEAVPGDKLPRACLERHINGDSTFCMFLPGASDEPTSEGQWWVTLAAYLDLQLRADALGDWPERFGRAHGFAAYVQEGFELVASGVPENVVRFVRERSPVGIGGKLVGGRRVLCPCGSGKAVKNCHEADIVRLALSANLSETREQE